LNKIISEHDLAFSVAN